MNEQDYHSSFTAHATPKDAFDKISRVSEWWGKRFEGESQQLNDVFTVSFNNGDRYTAKIAEMQPDHKIVWDIIDAYQVWVKEPAEWVGTKITWEVIPQADSVEVKMTHTCLGPELECFNQCTKGWNYLTYESLSQFMNKGEGRPV